MTYDQFIQLSDEFGTQLFTKEIPLPEKVVRFASFVLNEDAPSDDVMLVLATGTALVVLFENYSKEHFCETCYIFFIEEGYGSMALQEFDMRDSVSDQVIVIEEDVKTQGIIGIAFTAGEKGIMVDARGPVDFPGEGVINIDARVIHNALEFVQTAFN